MKALKITSLSEQWSDRVKRNPSAIAVIDLAEGRLWSFADLERRIVQAEMVINSLSPGSRIAFGGSNHSEWIVRFIAIQKREGIALALDPGLSSEQRIGVAHQQRVHFLWEEKELRSICPLRIIRKRSKIAFEKLTSGSTGTPRVIPWSHENLLIDGFQIMKTMGIHPSDLQLGLIPLGHSYGMGSLVLPLLLQGTTIALAPEFVPTQIPGWIQKWKLTVFPSVPAILQLLSASPSIRSLAPLRTIISAGARLEGESARLFHKKFGLRIHNFYGSTETGGIAYDRTGRATEEGRAIGKPLKGVTITLNPQGRIRVKSGAVAIRGGSHLMADTGYWNTCQELVLTGRLRPPINVGGKKIFPAEIEKHLREMKGVGEIWVGSIEEKQRDYLVVALESQQSELEIYKQLGRYLPDWKIPKKIRVLTEFPRTIRGKIDLVKIKSLF